MKKALSILLVLFAFALILQYVVNMMINEHVVEYSVKTEDNSYIIKENFRYLKGESFYDFTITDENDLFYVFSFNGDFNKQEEIITDVKFFTTKDLQCIYPIYKRNKTGNLSCIYQGNQVSYSYLEQINNYDIGLMTKELEKMGYEYADWEKVDAEEVSVEEAPSIKAYPDNILDDYYFTMWNYKGIVILSNQHNTYRMYLNEDQYNNTTSALVGKYYVTVVNEDTDSFNYFMYYNVKDFGKGVINTEDGFYISRNFYFNGVYNKKLYMVDLDTKKQIAVDPITEKASVVGNEKDGYLNLIDGELVTVKAENFLKDKVYFTNKVSDERFDELGAVEIIKENTSYYFITNDGGVYRVNEDKVYKPVLLFKLEGLTEWKVSNGDVLAVAGNTVYFYNEGVGLRKIAVNNELNYNHYNIVDFYKE